LSENVDIMLELITGIGFWIVFFIKFFITELINSKSMNTNNSLKIILFGVGAYMWG